MNGGAGDRQRPAALAGPDAQPERPRQRRVFIAVPLPEASRNDVAGLVGSVRAAADPAAHDVRWVRLDGLHLTLRFIGPVDAAALGTLADALETAAARIEAFDVTLEGAGAFPARGRPRAIWLGVGDGFEGLEHSAAAVEDALAELGIARSERPFRAHLTVARADGIRTGADVARRLIEAARDWRTTFTARELVLFETIAGGGPARYEPLHAAPFGGAPGASGLPGPRRLDVAAVLPSVPSAGVGTSVGVRRKEQRPGT